MLSPGTCQVWRAPTAASRPRLLSLLSDAEYRRWERFRRVEDQSRFLVAHALARIVLGRGLGGAPGDVAFSTICPRCGGDHGKPRVEYPRVGAELSLSHSGEQVIVAVALHVPLGVDIEQVPQAPPSNDLIEAALSQAERHHFATLPESLRRAAFARYWTRKEAVLKATGHGLSIEPNTLTVSPPGTGPRLIAWDTAPRLTRQVFLHELNAGPNHAACLAMLDTRLEVEDSDGTSLLLKA